MGGRGDAMGGRGDAMGGRDDAASRGGTTARRGSDAARGDVARRGGDATARGGTTTRGGDATARGGTTTRGDGASYPPPRRAARPSLGVPPVVFAPPVAEARAVPKPLSQQPKRDLEDFVGGSVLAWLGGIAVLAGLAFLLTIAISSGWIGEGARTALAGVLSAALLAAGVWLREHKEKTEASLAAAAVGIAGLFGTLVVAGPVYHLIPTPLAFAGAFATGAAATVLAIRWRAQVMGWLGLLGALWAPTALGAFDGGGMTFLAIAFAATIPVLIHERWTTLGAFAYLTTTMQWVTYVAFDTSSLPSLIVFGTLSAAYALGVEANRRGITPVEIGPEARTSIHPIAVSVLGLNALILAATGWSALADGETWLVCLAITHIALGVGLTHDRRISRELALTVLSIGVIIANIAFASIATGLPLVLGWAVSALPFAAILGARSDAPTHFTKLVDGILGRPDDEAARRADRILAIAGMFGQIALAGFQSLAFNAPVDQLNGPLTDSTALAATGAIAVAAWACARLINDQLRPWLDTLALAAVAQFTGLALEGAALAAALAAQALGLASLARRTNDQYAAWAAVGFAALSMFHTLGTLATPDALLNGLDQPLAAAGALAAVAAALYGLGRTPLPIPDSRRWLETAAAVTLLYLASVEVVTLAGPEHTGQTLLSVLWALVGVGALVRGLLTDDRELRQAALLFLGVTIGKVFLYDMASLDSLYRVGSLIGLGLLLLTGAFAWQQVRGTYSGRVD
nr:DUF2339 domain-containing protein [Solirubrobacter soli]